MWKKFAPEDFYLLQEGDRFFFPKGPFELHGKHGIVVYKEDLKILFYFDGSNITGSKFDYAPNGKVFDFLFTVPSLIEYESEVFLQNFSVLSFAVKAKYEV